MRKKAHILVVDDEKAMCLGLSEILTSEGYEVEITCSSDEALKKINDEDFDLVITDLKMPGISGMEVLEKVKQITPDTIVIVLTAYATVGSAVEAMKKGAYDYIPKPFKIDEIRFIVRRAIEQKRLADENKYLRSRLEKGVEFGNMVGKSKAMQEVFELVRKVAPTSSTVLIQGETGTGKELVARAIHQQSPRRDQPFVTINSGALPETLLESELFGHAKGAFTGASRAKEGLFEAADGGTFFLDEISGIGAAMQVRLLRVVQEQEVQRIGETKTRKVDVRIIAATNCDLKNEVKEGKFREDLYYRLNVVSIVLPPLRQRKEDIPLLANHFLKKYASELNKPIEKISSQAMDKLMSYHWPGNVRELENAIERAVILGTTDTIQLEDLPSDMWGEPSVSLITQDSPRRSLEEIEKAYIMQILKETNFHYLRTAEILGINRKTLYRKIKKYNLQVLLKTSPIQ
ncbi:sigma-54-dependent Fis family transcriptional regulator [candidate division KSB1 bacterium]|nr:MAG: sigma-54-dependent Fis family transcriptional regulator [candidate division KSB1 bacterium]